MRFDWFDPRRSVRARLTFVGSAVLVVGLAIGAIAFARLFELQLIENLDASLRTQANDRARAIDAGLDPATQLATAERETAVVVFTANGDVLANRGFADPSPLFELSSGESISRTVDVVEEESDGGIEIESEDLRLHVAQPGQSRVIVASKLEAVGTTVDQARALLVIGLPLIALTGSALLWIVVGRALGPVDRMRRDADAIAGLSPSGAGAEHRVYDPETTDEFGRLATTLNDMLGRLDASAAALRRFVSDSSHEIRSPITNIRARIETAAPEEWADAKADVIGEVERIERIIDDLTYLARSDEGRTKRSNERIELDELLFAEVSRLQHSGSVSVDGSQIEPIVISGDRGQIERAIRNLVDNAERHASTAVRLAVTVADGSVVVDIDDDGPGIPVGERRRVFDRFVRLDESRQRSSGGSGLGLAIVKEIVIQHGGTVDADTAPLGGARFRIALPSV